MLCEFKKTRFKVRLGQFLTYAYHNLKLHYDHERPQGGGGGKRGPLTPLPGQNSMFFDFLEENSMFLDVFREIVCFCPPPWKILPSPGKKVCGRP